MTACPRCGTHVGSLDEFHVCVEPLHAQFTRQEQQLAYLTERVDALHKLIEAALPPRSFDERAALRLDAECKRRERETHPREAASGRMLKPE